MTDQTSDKAIAERLRKYRLKMGKTQEEMAIQLDMSLKYYGDVERCKISPSREFLVKIVQTFDVSADYLLWGGRSSNRQCPLVMQFYQLPEALQREIIEQARGMLHYILLAESKETADLL